VVVFHVPRGFGDELAHNGPFDERRRPIDVTVSSWKDKPVSLGLMLRRSYVRDILRDSVRPLKTYKYHTASVDNPDQCHYYYPHSSLKPTKPYTTNANRKLIWGYPRVRCLSPVIKAYGDNNGVGQPPLPKAPVITVRAICAIQCFSSRYVNIDVESNRKL